MSAVQMANLAYMTDKVEVAIEASMTAISNGKYIPLINMPRVFRPDWRNEIQKRMNCISSLHIEGLYVDREDVISTIEIMSRYGFNVIETNPQIESLPYTKENERRVRRSELDELLILAGYTKVQSIHCGDLYQLQSGVTREDPNEATLVVLETTGRVLDVAVLNYVFAKGYDIKLLDALSEEFESEITSLITEIDSSPTNSKMQLEKLHNSLIIAGSASEISDQYFNVQYITKSIPLGLTSINQRTAHLIHVDCEIKLLDSLSERHDQDRLSCMPSYLFVDLESHDLISEVPEIVSTINRKHSWRFYLNGKKATVSKFKTFCQFFPLDFIVVSGHGSSPNCRIVVYEFVNEYGEIHTVKLREHYQFLRIDENGMIEVETKQEFLMFDDIDYADKQKLRECGVSPRSFIESTDQKVICEESVLPNQVEGLALANGVFMGNLQFFANFSCPIIVLNTCSSMRTVGPYLGFAGARSVIGTAWGVLDVSAREFAEKFFQSLEIDNSVSTALHFARHGVTDERSGIAYWMMGTLDTKFEIGLQEFDEKSQSDVWLRRIVEALSLAAAIHKKGWLNKQDSIELEEVYKIAEALCNVDPDSRLGYASVLRDFREFLSFM